MKIKLNKQITFILEYLRDKKKLFGRQIRHSLSDGFPLSEDVDFADLLDRIKFEFGTDDFKDLISRLQNFDGNLVLRGSNLQLMVNDLSLEERLFIANNRYRNFDPVDFGIPAVITHDLIDELYPVPRRSLSLMCSVPYLDVSHISYYVVYYSLMMELLSVMVGMDANELIINMGECLMGVEGELSKFTFHRVEHVGMVDIGGLGVDNFKFRVY